MRVHIWGCVQKYPKGELNTIEFEGNLGVESFISALSERNIILSIRHKEREESPVWLTFESLGEAEGLLEHLLKVIEAYKEDEDYKGGVTPKTFILK